jgi:hypothetical protein
MFPNPYVVEYFMTQYKQHKNLENIYLMTQNFKFVATVIYQLSSPD